MCLVMSIWGGITQVWADGNPVDKVYHPLVIANERKFEWRFTSRQTDDKNVLAQRFAYGQAVSEYLIIEAYISGQRDESDDYGLQGIELEARYMLTDQGQYWADWGLLFEFEKQHDDNNFEFTTGVLFEKEFVRTSLTLNALLIYEWGENVPNEFETEFRLQYRYRFMPEVQPAIEIYTGEDFVGIGPAFMGVHRYSGIKQLKWELAAIAGFNGNSKDRTLRFAIEYEF
ncbi:MAG: hypothetical protein NWQ54_24350 [Paraglaciecola sp.]|uniref:hypothetical protein n=1 Tax=Paraglaciecola sp. TaxID=1920173 RepID=UPI00273EA8F8|nr:hypothetical protein [Paraglaciecola sp.]MDP5032611.1 hypothetical protein [Paraglaciecola sp.]MDP5039971.1 hypothetical protein [Paraglaciecola sp.]MDP5134028.1 hypothetical protein [Paraglaciecola sp.]